jgi:hypothetical protein
VLVVIHIVVVTSQSRGLVSANEHLTHLACCLRLGELMHRLGGVLCVAWLLWGNPDIAHADALRRAGQAIHGDASNKQQRTRSAPVSERRESRDRPLRDDRRERSDHHHHHRHHHDDWQDDEDDEQERIIAMGFLKALLFPFILPRAIVQDMNPQGYTVPAYPYSDSLAYTVTEDPELAEQHKLLRVQMRLGATARSPQLMSGTFAAQIDFSLPVALQVGYRVLGEADAGQRTFVGFGNAQALYRIAESRHLRFHTGVDYLQWLDAQGLSHGLAFVYGFDAFPAQPISFGSRISIGGLGKQVAYAFQWRTYLGVMLSRYEIQVAYDHLDIGGVQLGGLQLSMQVHL